MKRIVVGMVAVLFLLAVSVAARAEEGAKEGKEGMEVEVGIKTWTNKLKHEDPATESVTSKNTTLIGPVVEAKFQHNIFAEASYLFSISDYKMDTSGGEVKFDRKDIDLAAGYMITHEFGAFVGYRNSTTKEKESGVKGTVYGPLVGVLGHVPVNEAFSIYGKATYLINKTKIEGGGLSTKEDSPGWIAEIGVKYEFSKEISANLGYQYETTKGKDSSVKDTFAGFTLGAMYAF